MTWRFTLIDRNGKRTVIEEPNGWADLKVSLRRHPQRHGTFREIQADNFEFFDKAAWLLKDEYEAYGAKGFYELLIESRSSSGFREWYRGVFSFSTYKFTCKESCFVTIKVDQLGPVVDLINGFDQKVDITKLKSFDGQTDLAPYNYLNFSMILPSKVIRVRAEAYTGVTPPLQFGTYDILNDSNFTLTLDRGIIQPRFKDVRLDEIETFKPSYQFDYIKMSGSVDDELEGIEIVVNEPSSDIQGTNVFEISMRLKGELYIRASNSSVFGHNISGKLYIGMKYGASKIDVFPGVLLHDFSMHLGSFAGSQELNLPWDFSWSGSVTLNRTEKIWLYYYLEHEDATSGSNSAYDVFEIRHHYDAFFKVSSNTKTESTPAKVFMINEAISRVIESVTDNKLKLYSEYFGRTNSQPYAFPSNGCGAQRVLTNGLDIRQSKLADNSEPAMTLSMKDIFDALAATDNIGLGVENDTIRIENWKWFYKPVVIHRCLNIESLERTSQEQEIYSTFKFGYDRWEAEDFNGLDEILTKREYRIDIPAVQNTLEQICKFIVSGYAIEVTRRKGGGSSDWRYDNNTFMICVEPDGSAYKVELNNILNPANIIDPPTVYNFRLTPIRNAMRWFDRVIGSYRNVNSGHKIIFGSGEGNYVAEGQLAGVTCRLEAGVIKENQDLTLTAFADQADALPIMWAERVKFRYPLGTNEYRKLYAQPYGLIEFSAKCDRGFGWIDLIEYEPNEGMADFTLIPQIK